MYKGRSSFVNYIQKFHNSFFIQQNVDILALFRQVLLKHFYKSVSIIFLKTNMVLDNYYIKSFLQLKICLNNYLEK